MAEQMGRPESVNDIPKVIEQIAATARVGAAFGQPITVGDQTVIPVAEVMCGMGFGMGGGTGPMQNGEATGSGSGGGGGGGARSRPVATIIVDRNGVRVQPVVDATRVALAALAMWGVVISIAFGVMRQRKMGRLKMGGLLGKGKI